MNITILSLVFPPETGAARRVGELAESLAARGHEVSVVTGFPTYPRGVLYDGYRKTLLHKERWANSVTLLRVYSYTSPLRDSVLRRMLQYLSFSVTAGLGALWASHPDVVYVVSPPYFLGLTGRFVARMRGCHMAFDVQDSWPEAPIALGLVKNRSLVRALLWLERHIYAHSDVILALSPLMRDNVVRRGAIAERAEVVYNWVDLTAYAPTPGDASRFQHGLVDKFIVLFAGNVGRAQGLDAVIDVAERLRDRTDVCFVILGDGVERRRLMGNANARGLSNVTFLEPVPEVEVPPLLGMADALLVTLARAKHREAALPSKIQIYMASAKPIIAAVEGAAAQVIAQADCGVVVEPDSPESLAAAVLQMRQLSIADRQALGANGRRYAEKHFARDHQCGRIAACLENLVASPGDARVGQ